MAAYYTSQAYDTSPGLIWGILTDFPSWPSWFPNMSSLKFENGHTPGPGAQLLAHAEDRSTWARWRIVEWEEAQLLVCEFDGTNSMLSGQVQTAYLQFQLIGEPEGCTLEVEIAAEGYGLFGDFFVGTTLGMSARRMLPQLVDAFTDHVIDRVREMT
jgi:hypothetical protein